VTFVFGYARDPESTVAKAGCEVTASIYPRGSTVPPISSGRDRYVTGIDGRWELNLPPTAGTGVLMKIREWQNRTLYIDVPASDNDEPIDVETIIVDPNTGEPPPSQSQFITRAELGQPLGPASLGEDGIVPTSQLPPSAGGDPVVDWFHGHGPPDGTIVGAAGGDMYFDDDTGQLYQLR
jgi:hypothetical protein